MFDIAFSELMVIHAGGVVVIGPERLPKVRARRGICGDGCSAMCIASRTILRTTWPLKEAKQLRGSIGKEIASVEQTMQEARMALEQKILDAQMGKSTDTPDEQKPSVKQSSTTTSTPV